MFGIMNTFIGGESASTPEKSQGQPQKDQCDMFINVVYSGDKKKSASQNPNHEWFLKKRKFLERKGLLRSKSEPYIPPYKHRRDKAKAGQSSSTGSSTEGSHSQQPKVIFKHDTTRPQPAKVNPKVEPGVRRPVSGRPSKRSRKTKKAKLLNPAVAGPAIAQRAPVPGDVSDSNQRAISLLNGLNIPALAPASINPSKYAAIDCEMVGCGPQGHVSMLARCSVVSYEGDVIFDEYIKPDQLVTCYRTRWSGIRPRDLVNAMPFQEAKKRVAKLLHGKVVVGHAVHHDFQSLAYVHPPSHTRDTQKIPLLNLKGGFEVQRTVSLKILSKAILNDEIQMGRDGHSSLEDARATMKLYRAVASDWEKVLATGYNFWGVFKGLTSK
ncbi:interferon-stimulated 20 kDa exonuclease-like 2 isoform X1 [Gadus macrocephalus]|uniref:interferon-stimulated 20 kDa exonuclease-like 2 isoform X1 n=1 Tax=Gadus macrocephalus TaxID=80720 RepID=UPI0028CB88E4|nr:interferon-stimulated 20 kDa exonuclease-like 2 isoform X1 [Gadus macrocephalus]